MNGIELIAKEREEQLTKHGRTVENDVRYNERQQLEKAASALVNPIHYHDEYSRFGRMPSSWDDKICEKMVSKPYKERLIIAGALIAAELDRLIAIEKETTI